MLTLTAFTIYRHHTPLLHLPTLQVSAGAPLTLMGPSGCGKSSLLAAIIGSLPRHDAHTLAPVSWQGALHLDGEPFDQLPIERRGIGLLFQDDLLFAHLTVAENLLFATAAGRKGERMERVSAALEQAGLSALATRLPHQISGGERARISVLRALLARPRALLLDEPFAKLDQPLRAAFRRWVFAQTQQIPVLMVTHDPNDAPADIVQLTGSWETPHA